MAASASGPVRVLMSEGSSLSARKSLTGLGRAGFHVEVVDGNPLCLARFSKFCRRLHAAPRFGVDPRGYLERVVELVAGRPLRRSLSGARAGVPVRALSRRAVAARRRRFARLLGLPAAAEQGRLRRAARRARPAGAADDDRLRRRRNPAGGGGACRSTSRRPSARRPRACISSIRPASSRGRSKRCGRRSTKASSSSGRSGAAWRG